MFSGTGSSEVTESVEEETTMALDEEEDVYDDSASTVDVQDVPVETVRGSSK